jgi:hypothetical protein
MKNILTFLIVLAVLSIAGVYRTRAVRIQNQTTSTKVNREAEREAARKIHRGLGGERKTIPEEVFQTKGDIVKRLELGLPVLTPNSVSFNAKTYLAERACAADAIFIGTVTDKKSQLTDDETFVFSNYHVYIDTVIKNDSGTALSPSTTIGISQMGGEIQVHGHRVKAISEAAQPMEVGNRYLLFVSFLPEKNTFASNNLAFILRGKDIIRLTTGGQSGLLGSGKDADTFISEVQAAAALPCKADGSGR